jgi:hypothetical protein
MAKRMNTPSVGRCQDMSTAFLPTMQLILNFALNGGITQDISPPEKGATSGFSSPFSDMLSGP